MLNFNKSCHLSNYCYQIHLAGGDDDGMGGIILVPEKFLGPF